MMTDETPSTDPKQQIPDLSGLADFQFGPAWARPGARQERPVSYPERRSGDRQGGDRRPRRDNREGRQPRGERRVDGQSGERRFNREDRTRGSFRNRRDQTPRSAMEEPTEGLRVGGCNQYIRCIAVPIRKAEKIVASISVATPVFRYDDKKEALIKTLLSNAQYKIETLINTLKINYEDLIQ